MTISLMPSVSNNFYATHVELMINSFERLLGRSLIECSDNEKLAEIAFNGEFALLSHNTQSEPLFNYANAKALALFEFSWEELITLPSRLSAEPVNQAERAKLLAQVTTQGFIDNYQGIRISKTGKRFTIRNAVVWNLIDDDGIYQGQAAVFSDWEFL